MQAAEQAPVGAHAIAKYVGVAAVNPCEGMHCVSVVVQFLQGLIAPWELHRLRRLMPTTLDYGFRSNQASAPRRTRNTW